MGWGPSSSDEVIHFLGGSRYDRCSRVMSRGFEIRFLDGVNVWSLVGSGCESFCRGPIHWIHGWGLSMGSIPGVTHW